MQGDSSLNHLIKVNNGFEKSCTQDLSYEHLKSLEGEFGPPFYILSYDKLRENYNKINTAFKSRYDNFIIGYSYKTNYLPYMCKELSSLGAYAEVVSRLEYDLAIKIGVDPKQIIFNGPLKTKADIHYALQNESKINLDSIYEVDFVKEYAQKNKGKLIKIGLRANFDISENGISPITDGYEVSRFGICVENGDLAFVLNELLDIDNIKVTGLHGHVSTQKRGVNSYRKITQGLCRIAKEYQLIDIEYIDIGGGISGEVPKSLREYSPSFDEYAEVICTVMNEEFGEDKHKPSLILEPGISLVANAYVFAVKVVEIKRVRNHTFVLVDGSIQNIKALPSRRNLPMKIVRQSNRADQAIETFHIVGFTCLERDYLAYDIHTEPPQIGDFIVFENVGAYTIVCNPPFIKERPAILVHKGNEVFAAREKETIKQFFNEELYHFN